MIIDNKENHHVVGVGFTAYAINVNIGVKTATKNAATIPLRKRLRDSILSPFFHSYIFAMYKNEALWI